MTDLKALTREDLENRVRWLEDEIDSMRATMAEEIDRRTRDAYGRGVIAEARYERLLNHVAGKIAALPPPSIVIMTEDASKLVQTLDECWSPHD